MGNSEGLQIFDSEEFGKVRVVQEDGELWFVGRDILKALDYAESSDVNKIFSDIPVEWLQRKNFPTSAGVRQTTIISEQGLYFFLGGSNKPKALPFRKHVAGTIMPSIRKHGAYMTPLTLENALADPRSVAVLLNNLADEQEARKLSESKVFALEEEKKRNAPMVQLGEHIIGAEGTMMVGEFSKLVSRPPFEIGRNKMFLWFQKKGYIFRNREGSWEPYKPFITKGLFEVTVHPYWNGRREVLQTVILVTPKGIEHFLPIFKAMTLEQIQAICRLRG
jgi:anti-repressor protein